MILHNEHKHVFRVMSDLVIFHAKRPKLNQQRSFMLNAQNWSPVIFHAMLTPKIDQQEWSRLNLRDLKKVPLKNLTEYLLMMLTL